MTVPVAVRAVPASGICMAGRGVVVLPVAVVSVRVAVGVAVRALVVLLVVPPPRRGVALVSVRVAGRSVVLMAVRVSGGVAARRVVSLLVAVGSLRVLVPVPVPARVPGRRGVVVVFVLLPS